MTHGGTRAAMAKAMSEGDLMGHIARLCRDLGLLAYHTHDSRRSERGYPDWTIVGPSGLLFRECKDEVKKPTTEQVKWLTALRAVGYDADLWRPSDLLAGRVQQELVALARMAAAAS